ncbi:MAG: AAA family ATPase [Candidatus Jorgensenbacteria bacterium]|nr:AAA family ATPase [Candidatus Jorgensenbacteria bacterium]
MNHFLERIELQGFKSFAPKTVLEFPARVTAIVGPNGSGKSNIIDALRWVLGEREAKQLRGDALENLIFAGTSKRSASGFARVSLVFKNHPRLFALDAPEVVIERRTDRSGTSTFHMNGDEVRLRDLVPILARARLGSRGLTMVGQGQSDLFVRSTPRERRVMIEEVLGLREYRLKKEHAERQLSASLINMEKVGAMLEELTPHLRFLRKQRTRFEKRSEIETSLRALENTYFGMRFHALAKGLQEVDAPRVELKEALRAKEGEVKMLARAGEEFSRGTSREEAVRALREKRRVAQEHRRTLERDLARLEVEEELAAKQVATTTKSVVELEALLLRTVEELKRALALGDFAAMRRAIEGVMRTIEKETGRKERSGASGSGRLTAVREELAVLERDLAGFETSEEELLAAERAATEAFKLHVEVRETKKNELRALERALQEKTFAREKLQLQLEELRHAWAATGRDRTELEALGNPEEAPGEDVERTMLRFRGELAAIGEIDTALVAEANETETRHEFLSREHGDLVKAAADLKKLIHDLDLKIHNDFKHAFREVNESFNTYFRLMFGGGRAHLKLTKPPAPKPEDEGETPAEEVVEAAPLEPEEDPELAAGVEIELSLPKKKMMSLDMLSGGEKSLISLAALFALIAVSPPPFLVLDEIDAPLDEDNARRFAELVSEFSKKTQFVIVTHNRATMEAADVLYGVTMEDDGVSKILSLKLES